MNALLDFLDSVWAHLKARRAAKAAADLARGKEIIDAAEAEAREMEAAAKELDAHLNTVPAVPPPVPPQKP